MIGRLLRLLSPTPATARTFFAGLALGIVALSLVGRAVSTQRLVSDHVRLHRYVMPESLFYQSASQMRATIVDLVDPAKILVVVGGSSVLFGNGQSTPDLWTDHLQTVLGGRYQVVNLAAPGGQGQEFGGVMAQILEREGYKLIYVMDSGPGRFGAPDGCQYWYFYWDAWAKGLLPPDAKRFQWIQQREPLDIQRPCTKPELSVRQVRSTLNSALFFEDLWNAFGYHVAFTSWTFLVRQPIGEFWTPRSRLEDPAQYYHPDPAPGRFTRFPIEPTVALERVLASDACDRDASGNLVVRGDSLLAEEFVADAEATFPAAFRGRMVVSLTYHNPYYRSMLSEAEHACLELAFERTAGRLSALGYQTMVTGMSFASEDYDDLVHLTASGGAKLAEELAPTIREKARQLGYAP